jgi:hypothetical protein
MFAFIFALRILLNVERHLKQNGPWSYQLSEIYQTTDEVTRALKRQAALPSSAVA